MADYTSSPYYNTAVSAAEKYGVPSSLFVAQIGQESGFNPNAQNGNAFGIAQFMPATAASLGVNPNDPTSSLYGAAKYDAQLYSQYGTWQNSMYKYGTTSPDASGNLTSGQQNIANMAASADSPLGHIFANLADATGWATDQANKLPNVQKTAAGIGDLLAIVTDLPRMTTIIAGLILLIAGLFMLGAKPAVQIVGQVKQTAGAVAALVK